MSTTPAQMSAEEWLTARGIEHSRAWAELAEKAIVDHFGSADKAHRMVELFPGRYKLMMPTPAGIAFSPFGIFGPNPTTPVECRVVDNLKPKEPTHGN